MAAFTLQSRQFHLFFKNSDFYEVLCDVSLKPIMQINALKKKRRSSDLIIAHFLSLPKSVAGVTTVSCVIS